MGILLGIISSLVASIVFAVILFGIKPSIYLSDNVCVTYENGEPIYKIKVVNKTKSRLINVSYHLELRTKDQGDITKIQEIKPVNPPLTTLPQFCTENTDYALRIKFKPDPQNHSLSNRQYLYFSIQATHPFSNGVAFKDKKFFAKDLVKDCIFETGESIKIIDIAQTHSQTRTAQTVKTP